MSGWAKGYVNGHPSQKASNARAVTDLEWGCNKKQYAPACAHLGSGHGKRWYQQNYAKVKLYSKKPGEAKDPYGCFVEGDLFYNGWGVDQDYLEAHARFSKGCQQGYTRAAFVGENA